MTKTSIPYMPAPTPPKITSLNIRLISGTIPPSGVKESCMELTAPQLVSVVTVANNAEFASPKRTSFPSMLPVDCAGDTRDDAWYAAVVTSGFPCASAQYAVLTPARKSSAIAAQTAQPCRGEPVIFPSVKVKAEGIAKMKNISRKFVNGVGLSNGGGLFVLKKPPPFVPSSLIISCDAVGRCAITCCVTVCIKGLPSGPLTGLPSAPSCGV